MLQSNARGQAPSTSKRPISDEASENFSPPGHGAPQLSNQTTATWRHFTARWIYPSQHARQVRTASPANQARPGHAEKVSAARGARCFPEAYAGTAGTSSEDPSPAGATTGAAGSVFTAGGDGGGFSTAGAGSGAGTVVAGAGVGSGAGGA